VISFFYFHIFSFQVFLNFEPFDLFRFLSLWIHLQKRTFGFLRYRVKEFSFFHSLLIIFLSIWWALDFSCEKMAYEERMSMCSTLKLRYYLNCFESFFTK